MKYLSFWLKLSVFNFLLVAVLGMVMRYKIAFSLPFLEQKYLQESHSHFAFYGWITSALYVFVIRYLQKSFPEVSLDKYRYLLWVNMITSIGMMLSFLFGGYFWLSVFFSGIAICVGYFFYFYFRRDLRAYKENSKYWFLGAFFFATISSLGVFVLSFMMVTHHLSQNLYLAAQYFYLHFQYNGFFIFSGIGLLIFSLKEIGVELSDRQNKILFFLFFFGCLVGYGLSVLWLELSIWLFAIIVLATLSQTYGAFKLYYFIHSNWYRIRSRWRPIQRYMLLYVGFAFGVKILLQLGSNIPAVNQFAFGFRNIVIAYLHLILLMCIATFLLSQILASQMFIVSKSLIVGLKFFMFFVFLNEALLGIMGVLSIEYISIPYANEMLFVISCAILVSLLSIFRGLKRVQ